MGDVHENDLGSAGSGTPTNFDLAISAHMGTARGKIRLEISCSQLTSG